MLDRRRPLDTALAENAALAALERRDRAFVRLLVATVLRRHGQIDALIAHCVERPLGRPAVQHVLGLGIAQLLFLGTPAHAAVDQSVRLAADFGEGRHRGLVNAVLRRLIREGGDLLAGQDAARLNTPDWLWRSWTAAYGEEVCRRIAAAHLAEPPLDLTVAGDPKDWAARLGAAPLPTGGLRLTNAGAPSLLPGYGEGAWWVQDAAAALPARLLGHVAGRRVVDLCAAPGGKTAQLAAAGAAVIAVDRAERRLRTLEANLCRLSLRAEVVCADGAAWRPDEPVDAVLLDAPCSATGTIRRHPDILHGKRPDDVARMTKAQDRLLAAAVDMVTPGGLVVYCSCSLQPEEGPARIAELLAGGAPVGRVPLSADEVGGNADWLTAAGDLRTLPCHLGDRGGMDGFFAARLRRN